MEEKKIEKRVRYQDISPIYFDVTLIGKIALFLSFEIPTALTARDVLFKNKFFKLYCPYL